MPSNNGVSIFLEGAMSFVEGAPPAPQTKPMLKMIKKH